MLFLVRTDEEYNSIKPRGNVERLKAHKGWNNELNPSLYVAPPCTQRHAAIPQSRCCLSTFSSMLSPHVCDQQVLACAAIKRLHLTQLLPMCPNVTVLCTRSARHQSFIVGLPMQCLGVMNAALHRGFAPQVIRKTLIGCCNCGIA